MVILMIIVLLFLMMFVISVFIMNTTPSRIRERYENVQPFDIPDNNVTDTYSFVEAKERKMIHGEECTCCPKKNSSTLKTDEIVPDSSDTVLFSDKVAMNVAHIKDGVYLNDNHLLKYSAADHKMTFG